MRLIFTNPYDLEIIDIIDKLIPAYKIGSGDITYIDIIKKIASKNKPYIYYRSFNNGRCKKTVKAGLSINKDLLLMQCNTNYTAKSENFNFINLNVLRF